MQSLKKKTLTILWKIKPKPIIEKIVAKTDLEHERQPFTKNTVQKKG